MPFGRYTKRVVPNNIVFDRASGLLTLPPLEWEIWGSESPVRSDATCCQITVVFVIISLRGFYAVGWAKISCFNKPETSGEPDQT